MKFSSSALGRGSVSLELELAMKKKKRKPEACFIVLAIRVPCAWSVLESKPATPSDTHICK